MSAAADMEHRVATESLGAYVLGALADDERERIDRHVQTCPTCRHDAAELQLAVDLLPAAVDPVVPPPELKSRIMAIVNSEAELLQPAGARADLPPEPVPAHRRSRGGLFSGWSLRPAAVGLACAAVLVAGVAGFALGGSGDDGGSPSSRTVVASVSPAVAAPGAKASLTVSGGVGSLAVSGMPNPRRGRVYQVWIKRPGASPDPTDALFTVSGDGSASVSVPGDLAGAEAVLVTPEPLGGSAAPTAQPVITAVLS